MDKIQILFFFISGFFLSRLIIKTEIPERVVSYLLDKKHASLSKIVFYLITISALLSFFIPNVNQFKLAFITVALVYFELSYRFY